MKKVVLAVSLFMSATCAHASSNGLVSIQSQHSVTDTVAKLEGLMKKKGLTVFNRIDHARNAANVDIKMPPSEVIIFGNPKVGTALMQCQPTIAIDLPLKVHVWLDKDNVWLSYYDPEYLKAKHQVKGCDEVFNKMSQALTGLTSKAIQ